MEASGSEKEKENDEKMFETKKMMVLAMLRQNVERCKKRAQHYNTMLNCLALIQSQQQHRAQVTHDEGSALDLITQQSQEMQQDGSRNARKEGDDDAEQYPPSK